MAKLSKSCKFATSLFAISVLLIFIFYLYQDPLFQLYDQKQHLFTHTLLEMFSVLVCFSISMYGWKAFDDIKNRTLLWLPFIFLAVGTLDFFHLMTYPGMPFFITESSIEKTGWFWIIARFTASVGLLFLVLSTPGKMTFLKRRVLTIFSTFYLGFITWIIYYYEKQLPILIISDIGPTQLKNILEYLCCLFLFVALVYKTRKFIRTKDKFDLELLFALAFLLLSELTLTIYQSISDPFVVLGHIIKTFGYTYILKAYFFSRMQITFLQKAQTERTLKNTQNILQSVFNYTPDSITIMDIEGRVLSVNQGFETVYGWKEEEVKGKLFRELMPELQENIDKVVEEVSQGKSLIAYETIRQRKDGRKILINMTISPVKNEDGEVIQLAAISRDLTNQKQVEKKLLEAEQELKQTVRKQQGIIFKFKKLNNQYIHVLCDGELLYQINLKPEYVVGKGLEDLGLGQLYQLFKNYYDHAWEGQDVSFEVKFNNRVCIMTLKPIIKNGIVYEVIGSVIDISQLKKTEELLQKSEKLAVVGELAAGLAHEIRNPLTTLKGFTQLLASQDDRSKDNFIDLMLSELDRIELITNEFMAVAKPQVVNFREQDLINLLNQVIAFSKPQALLYGIEINVNYKVNQAFLYCEGNQIKQVFINLIKNAMEAMPNGGELFLQVRKVEAEQIEISVKDTGVGISKEILPRLGEPFYTLKEKGTGLGLMVSFRIIESHHGTILFESEENKGTQVKITLPLSHEAVTV